MNESIERHEGTSPRRADELARWRRWVLVTWRSTMPRGRNLGDPAFEHRHRRIKQLMWLMVIGMVPYGFARGLPVAHVAAALAVPVLLEVGRVRFVRSRVWQASIVTLNLFTCASTYVYLAGGVTEAHFIYFVLVGVIALYQDWRPFLVGIGLVVTNHVLIGMVMPDAVFASHGSMTSMMTARLVLVHAGFLLASSVASIVAWKASEVQARSDVLTGLPNRIVLMEILDRMLALGDSGVAVLFVDLCGFKKINDVYGHDTGDQLLIEVANRIGRTCRRQDVLARIGGDEFVVVLPGGDAAGAVAAVARIVEACAEPLPVDNRTLRVTASIGVVVVGENRGTVTPFEVLSEADLAMYAAKRQFGDSGGFKMFVPSMRAEAREDFELELDLADAVGEGQLFLVFQPVIDMVTSRIVGAEALVRWTHPTQGLIGPADFIPAAERTGLIVDVGRWVLEEAVAQLAIWNERYPEFLDLSMHVNLSTHQLHSATLVDEIRGLLQPSSIIADRLVIEITESALLGGERDIRVLRSLKDFGVRLALDDFGTGYSSLSNLARLPIDELKVDKSFTDDVPVGPNRTLMAGMLAMAAQIGMVPIVEGIERPEQVRELLAMGARVGQGYYYSRPISSEAFMEKLSQQASEDALPSPVVSLTLAGGSLRTALVAADVEIGTRRTG